MPWLDQTTPKVRGLERFSKDSVIHLAHLLAAGCAGWTAPTPPQCPPPVWGRHADLAGWTWVWWLAGEPEQTGGLNPRSMARHRPSPRTRHTAHHVFHAHLSCAGAGHRGAPRHRFAGRGTALRGGSHQFAAECGGHLLRCRIAHGGQLLLLAPAKGYQGFREQGKGSGSRGSAGEGQQQ